MSKLAYHRRSAGVTEITERFFKRGHSAERRKLTERKRWLLCFAKYLWVLVLAPKVIQLPVCLYFLCMAIFAKAEPVRFSRSSLLLLLATSLQATAVACQVAQGVIDFERVFAAINTFSVWFVGIGIYALAINEHWGKEDLKLLGKYLIFNFAVLVAIYVFSRVTSVKNVTILGMNYRITGLDFSEMALDSGSGVRFRGMMGTALAPSHLFLLSLPVCVLAFSFQNKWRLLWLGIFVGAYVAVMATHSRAGILMDSICVLLCFFCLVTSEEKTRNIAKPLIIITLCLVFLLILVNYQTVLEALNDLFNSRAGSNRARFDMYEASIEKVLNESPFIGIGIKYMINSIPYGSHCTYIGIFYKSGILGTVFYVAGFFGVLVTLYRNCKDIQGGRYLFAACLCYFGFLLFSDLDSSNWVICLAFLTWGVLSKLKINDSLICTKEAESEEHAS